MGDTAEFSAALLDPNHPVPSLVTGQTACRYVVYRNNVTVGLMRALEANFPVVRRLLGEQYFAGFARDFAQCHPPQSPLMFRYGGEFPDRLESEGDLARYPYLGDVARVEILWRESYHAADAPVMAGDALAALDPDTLFNSHFIIHPATHLLQSRFAVHSIFDANKQGSVEQAFDPALPQSILVTRPLHDVAVRAVTSEQFAFFLALKNADYFGDAVNAAADLGSNFDLSDTLALLLQSGAFQAIQAGNEQRS